MLVLHSKSRRPDAPDTRIAELLREVSVANLRSYVEMLAFPRHYVFEREANVRARNMLVTQLRGFGYTPLLQGTYDNIVVTSRGAENGRFLLLGAHYDSVPGTPGADDNGSAVAVCLECARLIRKHNIGSAMIVFFNREEDGLIGSTEFVEHLALLPEVVIDEAHVFEMVGFTNRATGSQRMPPGIPAFAAPDVGDFVGLLANRDSNAIADSLLKLAATYVPASRVIALKMYLGVEKYFSHFHRSDHAPFWKAGIPSIMWTDTSEFRNPHYHRSSDTPDTLDYDFIAQVTQVALARAASRVAPPAAT
jgi:Zn-dependent M28 family amino/carboxypeptidase